MSGDEEKRRRLTDYVVLSKRKRIHFEACGTINRATIFCDTFLGEVERVRTRTECCRKVGLEKRGMEWRSQSHKDLAFLGIEGCSMWVSFAPHRQHRTAPKCFVAGHETYAPMISEKGPRKHIKMTDPSLVSTSGMP